MHLSGSVRARVRLFTVPEHLLPLLPAHVTPAHVPFPSSFRISGEKTPLVYLLATLVPTPPPCQAPLLTWSPQPKPTAPPGRVTHCPHAAYMLDTPWHTRFPTLSRITLFPVSLAEPESVFSHSTTACLSTTSTRSSQPSPSFPLSLCLQLRQKLSVPPSECIPLSHLDTAHLHTVPPSLSHQKLFHTTSAYLLATLTRIPQPCPANLHTLSLPLRQKLSVPHYECLPLGHLDANFQPCPAHLHTLSAQPRQKLSVPHYGCLPAGHLGHSTTAYLLATLTQLLSIRVLSTQALSSKPNWWS